MGRIQINLKATPSTTSKNGMIAAYLKSEFGSSYGSAYLDAAYAFWYPIALEAMGADPEKVAAARNECDRLYREHHANNGGHVPSQIQKPQIEVESFDDMVDDDDV